MAAVCDGQGRTFVATVLAGDFRNTLRVAPKDCSDPNAGGDDVLVVSAPGIRDICLATDGSGRPVVVWNQAADVGLQLQYACLDDAGRWSRPEPICGPPGTALAPATALDRTGRLWCAYQSNATGTHHIYVAWLAGGEWSFGQRISDGDGHCFAPALCAFGDGVRVVWDGRIDRTYGVYMREVDTNPKVGEREPVAVVVEADTLVANPTIVALDIERSLVMWERAPEGWGRRNRVIGSASRPAMSKGNYMAARRDLHGAMIAPEGVAPLAGDINRRLNAAIPSPVRTRPVLGRDACGGLWLTYRQILSLATADAETGFVSVVTCFRDGDWSPPVVAPDSAGTSDMPAGFTPDASGGLLLACISRKDQHYTGCITALPAAGAGEIPPVGEFDAMATAEFDEASARDRVTLSGDYDSPVLLWGDLHRHTNLSACRWWVEGAPGDAYRYALVAAELDFLAVTDHMRALTTADTRAEEFSLANGYNQPGIFTAFCACEVSLLESREGHTVVLSDCDPPLVPQVVNRRQLRDAIIAAGAVGIPHHPGDPRHSYPWEGHDDAIAPVAEIYQPYRTSFEGPGCPAPSTPWVEQGGEPMPERSLLAAWRAGLKLGVVASSDHLSISGAYAGVWADSNTRRDILAALRQRRCFAATDKIELAFWADGYFMGESFDAAAAKVTFKFRCVAAGEIGSVELLADGAVVHTFGPSPKRSRVKLTGRKKLAVGPGEHFYYVRVQQVDGNMAWSSPIWVTGRD